MVRQAARLRALADVRVTRHDAEGAAAIDVEANSHPVWTKWARSLNPQDSLCLLIWRSGAQWSDTRRHYRPAQPRVPLPMAACSWCGATRGSVRHYIVECPHFAAPRRELQNTLAVPPGWLQSLPRVSLKTAWVTPAAGVSPLFRAHVQLELARLGVLVVKATHGLLHVVNPSSPRPP